MNDEKITLSDECMIALLRAERNHDDRIGEIENITGLDLISTDEWQISLNDIVIDSLGFYLLPNDIVIYKDAPETPEGLDGLKGTWRENISMRACRILAPENDAHTFLCETKQDYAQYREENPGVPTAKLKRRDALARVIQEQFKWDTNLDNLTRAGIIVSSIAVDLMPIVLQEMGVDAPVKNYRETVVTGAPSECLAYVEYLEGLN